MTVAEGTSRVVAYGLVLALSVELAVWGVFSVPLRVAGLPVPVGPALALVANPMLARAGTRVCGSRWGGGVSFALWALIATALSSSHHGSVVLPASAMSYAYLLAGTIGGGVALALPGRTAPMQPG